MSETLPIRNPIKGLTFTLSDEEGIKFTKAAEEAAANCRKLGWGDSLLLDNDLIAHQFRHDLGEGIVTAERFVEESGIGWDDIPEDMKKELGDDPFLAGFLMVRAGKVPYVETVVLFDISLKKGMACVTFYVDITYDQTTMEWGMELVGVESSMTPHKPKEEPAVSGLGG